MTRYSLSLWVFHKQEIIASFLLCCWYSCELLVRGFLGSFYVRVLSKWRHFIGYWIVEFNVSSSQLIVNYCLVTCFVFSLLVCMRGIGCVIWDKFQNKICCPGLIVFYSYTKLNHKVMNRYQYHSWTIGRVFSHVSSSVHCSDLGWLKAAGL